MKEKDTNKTVYTLHLTERQAKLLSYSCDRFARCIEGQDWVFQELMEGAWEKRCKEAVGGHGMDGEWDGGWHAMREEAVRYCKDMKKRFWGLEWNAMYGVHYDDVADIIWDIHQVIRHQLWVDRPEGEKSHITVDAGEPMQFGSEPLSKIESHKPHVEVEKSEAASVAINSLQFSHRVVHCLQMAGITTLEDLLRVNKKDLMLLRNFGRKCLTEVNDFFEEHGYKWGNERLCRCQNKDFPWVEEYYLPKQDEKKKECLRFI